MRKTCRYGHKSKYLLKSLSDKKTKTRIQFLVPLERTKELIQFHKERQRMKGGVNKNYYLFFSKKKAVKGKKKKNLQS